MTTREETRILTAKGHNYVEAMKKLAELNFGGVAYYWQQPREFRITIEDITPEPEEPQWWYWSDDEWGANGDNIHFKVELYGSSVWVYGTTSDRDEKRDALLEAAKKAGKP